MTDIETASFGDIGNRLEQLGVEHDCEMSDLKASVTLHRGIADESRALLDSAEVGNRGDSLYDLTTNILRRWREGKANAALLQRTVDVARAITKDAGIEDDTLVIMADDLVARMKAMHTDTGAWKEDRNGTMVTLANAGFGFGNDSLGAMVTNVFRRLTHEKTMRAEAVKERDEARKALAGDTGSVHELKMADVEMTGVGLTEGIRSLGRMYRHEKANRAKSEYLVAGLRAEVRDLRVRVESEASVRWDGEPYRWNTGSVKGARVGAFWLVVDRCLESPRWAVCSGPVGNEATLAEGEADTVDECKAAAEAALRGILEDAARGLG